MKRHGVITFTIKNADSQRELITGLLIDKIDEIEFIRLYDVKGSHDTLYGISSSISAEKLLNIIHDKVNKLIKHLDKRIYFDSSISILISLDDKICEIFCCKENTGYNGYEEYIISKYINGQIIG